MPDPLIRTRLLIGDTPLARLTAARVAVFGVGGVGGFCVEALARAGIGTLHLYDDDTISESNLNRQIVALHSTIGLRKAEVMADRVRDINPQCQVKAIQALQVKIISAMGSGNKLDPTAFTVTDISKTQGCPLARVMRKELRKRGIQHLKVVYSTELPRSPLHTMEAEPPVGSDTRPGSTARRDTPGSISFVPGAAGLVVASAVIRELGQF